jgi:hypothetical protein
MHIYCSVISVSCECISFIESKDAVKNHDDYILHDCLTQYILEYQDAVKNHDDLACLVIYCYRFINEESR